MLVIEALRPVTPITSAVVVGVVGGAACYFFYIYRKAQSLPTEWRQVGTLENIYVYPIKSCGPIRLEKAECSALGLRDGWLRDRIMMIVDEKSNFITARGYPHMLLISPTVTGSVLKLEYNDNEPISVDLSEVVALQRPKTAQVWGVPVPTYDCGSEIADWLTRVIAREGSSYRLVHYASQKCRTMRARQANKFFKFRKADTAALVDEVSFNLINDASVDDLNTRLVDCRVSHRNFRPNFVLKGAKPYEEDNWKYIKIGDNVFKIIKPCQRCVLTTINPETGERSSNAEPLETLKGYRQFDDPEILRLAGNSPRMGLQMALRSGPGGMVSLHDAVYVA